MKNFYLKHRILTVCFFFVIFVFLSVKYIGVSLLKEIIAQADSLQENLLDIEIVEKRKEKIPQMEENKKEIDSQREVLDVILNGNEVNFIEHLEKIAQETGNEIELEINESSDSRDIAKETRKKKKEGEEEIVEKINYNNYFLIKINLTGNYESLINFIHTFENDKLYVNIFSINIQKEKIDLASESKKDFQIETETSVLRENPFLDLPNSEEKNNSEDNNNIQNIQEINENVVSNPTKKEILKSLIEIIVYKKK